MAALLKSRSTCLMVCFWRRPRTCASPMPMACTPAFADPSSPMVALPSDSMRLTWRSSEKTSSRVSVTASASFATLFCCALLSCVVMSGHPTDHP